METTFVDKREKAGEYSLAFFYSSLENGRRVVPGSLLPFLYFTLDYALKALTHSEEG